MSDEEILKLIDQSLEAEIMWREQLRDDVLGGDEVTVDDIKYYITQYQRKFDGDIHLSPGDDSWSTVRARDILRHRGYLDNDSQIKYDEFPTGEVIVEDYDG